MSTAGTIREILHHKGGTTWTVTPDTTVFDAIKLMAEKNIGALLVLKQNRLAGIISERDYTRKVVLLGRSSKDTLVNQILSGEVVQVTPEHTVDQCLRLMTEHRVRHLPVLDGNNIVGIISIGDLVNHVINTQQSTIHQLETYITGFPTPPA